MICSIAYVNLGVTWGCYVDVIVATHNIIMASLDLIRIVMSHKGGPNNDTYCTKTVNNIGMTLMNNENTITNTPRPKQDGRQFTDDISA